MNKMVQHIEYLLHFHDCVIVPEWGAFIIQREKATFCVDNQLIKAPYTSLSFNSEINHNDGLLAMSIAKKDGISFDSANKLLQSEVDTLKVLFDGQQELHFGEIGTFKNENSRKIFCPDNSVINTLYGECSLHNISVKTVEELLQDRGRDKERGKGKVFLTRVANYAASVVILLGLILTLSTPININLSSSEQASLNLLKQQERLISEVESKSGELLISMPPATSISKISESDNNGLKNTHDCTDDIFFLIVASFPTEKDAMRYISESNDNQLKFICMDGKFRVFISSAAEHQSIVKERKNVIASGKYADAWICKK
ncbi:MAG: hypothetical protein J1F10_08055 [Muribaculaceae bacterium]|nr:hypothetical protein [Muribaculaceae bacterium]